MSDAREDIRDAIRRGLRNAGGAIDPDWIEDYVDSVMTELMETGREEIGWFILGGLEHVYRVQYSRMTDASVDDRSLWDVWTRNDL